ncbi:MAG: cell division protein FtsW [Alphaproteobacteria bacterium]|nr:MAG: cell division protein FtsW [Alphaproteobacteria bacterium]
MPETDTALSSTQSRSQPQAFSRMDRSFLGAWWWTVDRAMLGCIMALLVFGIALVATSSPAVAQKIGVSDYHFIKKHIIFLVPTLFLIIGGSMLSPRYVWRFASLVLLGGCIMMVLVLFFGVEEKGARRWISILGFSLQPSEFVKPAFVVVAAWLIALQKKSIQKVNSYQPDAKKDGTFPGYYIAVGLYFILLALLIMQPDLGMSIVLTTVFAVQIFIAGLRFRYMAVLFAIGSAGLVAAYFSLHHVRSRMDRFFNPDSGDNYQVEASLAAIKKGGIIGVGPGQGVEKINLPDAHADFTFSVLVEEGGIAFAAILIALFLFILLRGFKRLQDTHDVFSVLAAGGLLAMFSIQSLIHMGSSVNLLPAKGMTLPFISYGGSSMISMGIAMGMVLALTRQKGRTSIARSSMTMRRSLNRDADKSAENE